MNDSDLASVKGARIVSLGVGLDQAHDVVDLQRIELSFEIGGLPGDEMSERQRRGEWKNPVRVSFVGFFSSILSKIRQV